jgi:hypothetical protein
VLNKVPNAVNHLLARINLPLLQARFELPALAFFGSADY